MRYKSRYSNSGLNLFVFLAIVNNFEINKNKMPK